MVSRLHHRTVAIALVATLAVLAGCASRPPSARGYYKDREPGSRIPLVPLNQPVSAEVGAPIWQTGEKQVEIQTIARLDGPGVAILDVGQKLNLKSGTVGTLLKRSDNGQLAMCFGAGGSGAVIMAMSGQSRASACLVDKARTGVFTVAMFERYEKDFPLEAHVPYTVINRIERQVDIEFSTRKQLLYQGAGGGVLKLSYREFTSNDMARPSFTQDLTYEFNPNGPTDVGFKGLRMRVLSADNQGMKAIVERGIQD